MVGRTKGSEFQPDLQVLVAKNEAKVLGLPLLQRVDEACQYHQKVILTG